MAEQPEDVVDAAHDVAERRHLAAAVSVNLDVPSEETRQARRIAAVRGLEEGARDPVSFRGPERVADPLGFDVSAGAGRQLPNRGWLSIERGGDILERHLEDVVQKEGRAFERRQTLHGQHKGHRDVVGDRLHRIERLHQGVGEPRPDIGLSARPG